tara:strand:+ start:1303 stop:1704 length:402 start_codon:yes stop_codon:yes gene_type:complete
MSEEYSPFKMKGSPAKTGGIQGTSSHASALKQKSMNKRVEPIKRMTRTIEDRTFDKNDGMAQRVTKRRMMTKELSNKKAENWNEKLTKLTDKRGKLKAKKKAREEAGKGTKVVDWRAKRNQKKINKEMKKAGN